jgi:hypothetical protein
VPVKSNSEPKETEAFNSELTCPLGMNYSLWYTLTVEVSYIIQKFDVL